MKLSIEAKRKLFIWLRPICWAKGHAIDIPASDRLWYYCHRCWYAGAAIDMYMKERNAR